MKYRFLLILFFMLMMYSVQAEAVFEYDQYLEKVSSKPKIVNDLFKNIVVSSEILDWLSEVDGSLDPALFGSYDASFFFTLSQDGEITALAIDELRVTEPESFKRFVARLLSVKLPKPPLVVLDKVLNLDARTLYIDRKLDHYKVVDSGNHKLRLSSVEIDSMFDSKTSFRIVEPGYVDYPRIGETLVFSHESGYLVYAKVIEASKKSISLLAYKMMNSQEIYHLNWSFSVDRPKKNSRDTLKTLLESGLASASLAGIPASISSEGLLPGLLSLLGMTGAVLEESEKIKSFNFVRGDTVSLTKLSD
jgi:hypothetical protein